MDSLAPIIQGFWLESSSLDPSQPGCAYLSAALRFSDDLSGLSVFGYGSISISFRSSSSGQTRHLYLSTYDLQGSTLAGTVYASRKLDPFTPLVAGLWIPFSSGIKQETHSINPPPPPPPPTGPPSSAPAESRKPPFRSPMGPIQLREPGPTPSPPASKAFRSTPPALIPLSQVALTFPQR